jgi:hypothetical protein
VLGLHDMMLKKKCHIVHKFDIDFSIHPYHSAIDEKAFPPT